MHPGEKVVRRFHKALADDDRETLAELMADDIIWHEAGSSPISGDHEGRAGVFGFFDQIHELSGGTFRVELHDILANDDHVVTLSFLHGERDGKELDGLLDVDVCHVDEGQITEVWTCPHDGSVCNEFWL